MRTPTRSEVAAALLVSVPPGVGLAGFASVYLQEATSPTAFLVGAAASVALFAALMAGVVVGEADDAPIGLPEEDDHNR